MIYTINEHVNFLAIRPSNFVKPDHICSYVTTRLHSFGRFVAMHILYYKNIIINKAYVQHNDDVYMFKMHINRLN